MNKYTFTYYGWIPGYNDFDQDWIDVEANTVEEAQKEAEKYVKFAKHGPALVAVNGYSLEDYMARLAMLN